MQLVGDLRSGRLAVPPFPKIAAELHRIAQSPEPDLPHACKLIQREVELAGRMVKAACSPVYGGRPVTTLDAAAQRLGANGLRDIAMATAMSKVLRPGQLADLVRDVTRHSFVVAVLSQWLCEWSGHDKRHGFMCGLFHDIGRLMTAVALAEYGRRAPAMLEPMFMAQVSEELHAEVGSLVLESWGLDETVQAVAAYHHQPNLAPTARELAAIVHVADLADRLPAIDATDRYTMLMDLPGVAQCNLPGNAIREVAVGVDRVRADQLLNAVVG
jgi:putative nucleotidyltransferase with HDIG domain